MNFRCLDNIDWELLAKQKNDLVVSMIDKKVPDMESLEGVIMLLDALMDEAEEIGYYEYPEDNIE